MTMPARNEAITLAVVDDDIDVRTALARLLQSLGYRVFQFGSAEEFEAGGLVVDCLIADVRLPGLTGLELRERLRNRADPVPVVFITGDSERLAVELAKADGAPSVSKPFDVGDLLAAIASARTAAQLAQGGG